jgi:hypothetical protein
VKPAEGPALCPSTPVNNAAFAPGSFPKMLYVYWWQAVETRHYTRSLVTDLFVNYLVSSKQKRAMALHGFQLSQAQNKLSTSATNGT